MSISRLTRRVEKDLSRLHQKKYRTREGLFLAEGTKIVLEAAAAQWPVAYWVATADWWHRYHDQLGPVPGERLEASAEQMQRLSSLSTAPGAMAVAQMPAPSQQSLHAHPWGLALDGWRDPGNLGTLLRLADWFAVPLVLCSPDTVDAYNPKAVQAAMGSLLRVEVRYLAWWEVEARPGPLVAADASGTSLESFRFPAGGWLAIGSESHGLRPEALQRAQQTVAIPRYGGAESLNAATAAGILLQQWRLQAPLK
jgi:TrmH family RNA methyltransferase